MKFQFLPENFSRSENAPPFETRKIRRFEVERIFLKNKKMVEDIYDSLFGNVSPAFVAALEARESIPLPCRNGKHRGDSVDWKSYRKTYEVFLWSNAERLFILIALYIERRALSLLLSYLPLKYRRHVAVYIYISMNEKEWRKVAAPAAPQLQSHNSRDCPDIFSCPAEVGTLCRSEGSCRRDVTCGILLESD